MPGDIKYVTDEKDKRQEVILPFQIWKDIADELEALRDLNGLAKGKRSGYRH